MLHNQVSSSCARDVFDGASEAGFLREDLFFLLQMHARFGSISWAQHDVEPFAGVFSSTESIGKL